MQFWDDSITTAQWREMAEEQKKERRVHIRAYFLWKNGFPGSDLDRLAMAEFMDQFDQEFYQMESQRWATGATREQRWEHTLRLILQEHLSAVLRTPPTSITDGTLLPDNAQALVYLRNRMNYESHVEFDQKLFIGGAAVGSLLSNLAQNRPSWWLKKF